MAKPLRITKTKYYFQNSKSECRYLAIKAFRFNLQHFNAAFTLEYQFQTPSSSSILYRYAKLQLFLLLQGVSFNFCLYYQSSNKESKLLKD